MRAGFLSAAVALAAACSKSPAAAGSGAGPDVGAEPRAAAVDDTVRVQLGRSATLDAGRLVVTFVARLSDSRCPANVVCVWMGDAAVRIAARAGRISVEHDLHTGIEPHSLSVDRYVVTVIGLTPYPGTDEQGTPTVGLRVTAP